MQLIEFAKALIEFNSNPAGLPTFEVEEWGLDYFESCRVRIVQAREGVARLEFCHHTRPGDCSPIMGRIWVQVEEARTFHVEIPKEDVRGMAYGLLSTVADGEKLSFGLKKLSFGLKKLSFGLRPPRPGAEEGWEDDEVPF